MASSRSLEKIVKHFFMIDPNSEPFSWQKLCRYLWHALYLRCPICGQTPIFIPIHKLCRVQDWFLPLDGCPRCGYPYEREPGYFLMSTWAINYGIGSLIGIAIYLFLEWKYELPMWILLLAVMMPMILFNLLFVRHSKAFFLAIDLLCDPPEKREESDDDGGGLLPRVTPKVPQNGGGVPPVSPLPLDHPVGAPLKTSKTRKQEPVLT